MSVFLAILTFHAVDASEAHLRLYLDRIASGSAGMDGDRIAGVLTAPTVSEFQAT